MRARCVASACAVLARFLMTRVSLADGLNAATEWKDIIREAAKGMVVLAIMETLMLTRHSSWLEVRKESARRVVVL